MKRARGNRNQYDIAVYAGVSLPTYIRFEKHGSLPQRPSLEAICQALGISETELFQDPDLEPRPNEIIELLKILPALNKLQLQGLLDVARSFASPVQRGGQAKNEDKLG